MLPSPERSRVVLRAARIEIANLSSQSDESPELDVHSSPEIEGSAIDQPRRGIGTPVQLIRTLLERRVSAAHSNVGRDIRLRKELQANARGDEDSGNVARQRLIDGSDVPERIREKMNLTVT